MEPNDVKVSFAITTHNETQCLRKLLEQVFSIKTVLDEVVILDDNSTNEETKSILAWAVENRARVFYHSLNGDFATHKNYMTDSCKNEFIFNIDADELLDENLAKKFREILAVNQEVDMFRLPRINTVQGLTLNHITQWHWQISAQPTEIDEKIMGYDSDEFRLIKAFNLILGDNNGMIKYHKPLINWPDYQGRIYRKSDSIRWQNKVHETLVGFKKYATFPTARQFALLHDKAISVQEKQNEFYSTIR
jgi:glycosyltransferase involved in cell wall biosynthesis